MGIFEDSLNKANAGGSGGGVFFTPKKLTPGDPKNGIPPEYGTGRYHVRCEVLKEQESKKEPGVVRIVFETVILESDVPQRPAGSRCTYMQKKSSPSAAGNTKALLCALNGLDPNGPADAKAIEDEDWKTTYLSAIDETNPCKGLECIIEVSWKKRKDAIPTGGDKAFDPAFFPLHVFYPVPEAKEAAE